MAAESVNSAISSATRAAPSCVNCCTARFSLHVPTLYTWHRHSFQELWQLVFDLLSDAPLDSQRPCVVDGGNLLGVCNACMKMQTDAVPETDAKAAVSVG